MVRTRLAVPAQDAGSFLPQISPAAVMTTDVALGMSAAGKTSDPTKATNATRPFAIEIMKPPSCLVLPLASPYPILEQTAPPVGVSTGTSDAATGATSRAVSCANEPVSEVAEPAARTMERGAQAHSRRGSWGMNEPGGRYGVRASPRSGWSSGVGGGT